MVCEICGGKIRLFYEGQIRNGQWENYIEGKVWECLGCGVKRLDESIALKEKSYQDNSYRELVPEQKMNRRIPFSMKSLIRNKNVIDIGAGSGSFGNLFGKFTKRIDAYEINSGIIAKLTPNYNNIYMSFDEIPIKYDIAICLDVIEHVVNPIIFLGNIYNILNKGSLLILSTPNTDNILTKILPSFNKFYYRTQHRWYFNKNNLINTATLVGFKEINSQIIEEYSFDNFIGWIRDKKPSGKTKVLNSSFIDNKWKKILNKLNMGNRIYTLLEKV
jgi:2-polyprenyl-3-methyl-5-hydroxy-6-metoxy-1,4-benzoquinol methylase